MPSSTPGFDPFDALEAGYAPASMQQQQHQAAPRPEAPTFWQDNALPFLGVAPVPPLFLLALLLAGTWIGAGFRRTA